MALFADLSERDRQRKKDIYAYKANERRGPGALRWDPRPA